MSTMWHTQNTLATDPAHFRTGGEATLQFTCTEVARGVLGQAVCTPMMCRAPATY